ncbi:MAG: chromate transporter [Clostridium sp.]|nr:chromate transporter [Clostridium sp.]
MIYLLLFWTFLKIGAVSFGGGYAMIPLIQEQMLYLGWMSSEEFANILAVSEMTPGPIATNTATYVGAKAAGILGSVSATMGVTFPSFFIVIIIARFLTQFKENKIVDSILKTIRPVTIGLICSAVIFLAQTSLFQIEITFSTLIEGVLGGFSGILHAIRLDKAGIFIFFVIFVATARFKLHPVFAILSSGLLGFLFYIIFGAL